MIRESLCTRMAKSVKFPPAQQKFVRLKYLNLSIIWTSSKSTLIFLNLLLPLRKPFYNERISGLLVNLVKNSVVRIFKLIYKIWNRFEESPLRRAINVLDHLNETVKKFSTIKSILFLHLLDESRKLEKRKLKSKKSNVFFLLWPFLIFQNLISRSNSNYHLSNLKFE